MRPAIAALVILLPALAAAQPDFSQSTITAQPSVVSEGDVFAYSVTVRNSGNESAAFAELLVSLPLESLFVDLSGLENATVDLAEKEIAATLDLPPGGERRFRVRVVVPRDSGGNTLNPDLRVRYLNRATFNTGAPTDINSAPRTDGVMLGGVRFGAIEGALLAVLALYPVLWVLLPRRRRNHGGVAALVIGAGFLTMFVGLARRDAQTLTSWHEAQCTILDTRIRLETQSSNIRTGVPPRRAENRSYKPLLALTYTANGQSVVSTGYETGTRVSIGRGQSLLREYEQWKVGAQVPCWFNPDDVKDVIVIRGFGGAYFFAILPLALLAAGIYSLRN
jgi:Protein of unknown function (DUF3592)